MSISLKTLKTFAAITLATVAFSAQATPQTGYYIYDEAGHLIGEYDANGSVVQEHIYLGDRPVAVVQSGTVNYVTADQLNTPRAVTDQSATLEWSWTSDPFGNGQPTGSLTYNLRFPGQYFDAETGHNYNYFRDYDSSTGRYIESDPTGLGGGLNTYGYAYGNPASYTDFSGLCPNDCKELLANIENLRNELAKRESDLYQDQYDLPLLGRSMTIESHQREFRIKQANLREALDEYNSQGCDDDDLPPGTWNYATMPTPYPTGKNPGVFNMGAIQPGALGAAATAAIIAAIILSPVGI